MARIFLSIHGNGHVNCVPPETGPFVNGETFTLYFVPDGGATLDDVRAYDSHDFRVALPAIVNNELTMNFRTSWGNLYVEVYFSGSTPPAPSTPFQWLYKKIADKNNMVRPFDFYGQ